MGSINLNWLHFIKVKIKDKLLRKHVEDPYNSTLGTRKISKEINI